MAAPTIFTSARAATSASGSSIPATNLSVTGNGYFTGALGAGVGTKWPGRSKLQGTG